MSSNLEVLSIKMGVAENKRGRPKQNLDLVHKVSKLSELHDPVIKFLLTTKSSGYEIM